MIKNPIQWPNEAKCAVAITFDMDTDSPLHLALPNRAYRHVSAQSLFRYDEVAVPRILKMYREFNMRQTFFIPAWCIEKYPKTVEQIVEDGHEIAHHGYLHEHPNELTKEEEEYWFTKSIEVIKDFTGQRPRGFRAPLYNYSENSTDLLAQEGFLYDSSLMADDVPYLLESKNGKVIELPTHWAVDDWPQYAHFSELDYIMPIQSPQSAMEVFMSEFEAAYEFGGMFIPVWHPFVTGRLSRLRSVYRMLETMHERGDVWFATMEDIAQHVQKCIDERSHTPRVEKMPYYDSPISELSNNPFKK
ncbi:polysaccharide deacetylase [Virgibacillus byunsanensis]|uniref:Polysaccharide deacetylase n=1 Tax=Virgibacillus byunsanensis TaxID=570945 RepID=A0ABW3LQU0_9BACI